MRAKNRGRNQVKGQTAAAVRATISFRADIYETLGKIAKEKKVSLAWVVREATEQYLAEKWPLFGKGGVSWDAGGEGGWTTARG